MSLQLILGSSGMGKSHYLYEEIIKCSLEDKDTNYLMIVPEQFTMSTQRNMVAAHPNHGIMNIDVLSFMRLSFRVFEELGENEKIILDDTGKSMILRKIVDRYKDDLQIFQGNIRKSGFVLELKSMLSEIYQYNISKEKLSEVYKSVTNKPVLQHKLKDIITIYQGFQEYIEEKYITTEEILDVLYSKVDQSAFIKNSVICFDGFTGFTPTQTKLLAKLMKLCKKVYITVTFDEREKDIKDEEYQLFHLSKQTIASVKEIAIKEQVTVEPSIFVKGVNGSSTPYRFTNSKELAALEREIFRYPRQEYNKEVKDISIHVAKNPAREVVFTVEQIKKLIKEKNYRYKDIAVVCGDMDTYARLIEQVYEKELIPCFIDNKRGILANPAVEIIRASVDVILRDFSYESMFRYLRCSFSGIRKEDVDLVENYCLALGIRGFSMWNQEWDCMVKMKGNLDFIKLNEARKACLSGLFSLREVLKNKEGIVEEYSTAICTFLLEKKVAKRLEEYAAKFNEEGRLSLAKEYKQIYGMVLELFDKVVELLGDEKLTLEEYAKILDTGFEEIQVGIIPPSIDQIVVGDMERTRLKDIKALFLLGVNDGIIPKSFDGGGIISDMEREILASHNVELAPTKRQRAFTEQFYLYLALSKPKEHLYILYSKVGMDGKTKKASYLIGKLKQIFPKIKVEDLDFKADEIDTILAVNNGMEYLIEQIRLLSEGVKTQESFTGQTREIFKELLRCYQDDEEKKELLQKVLEGAFYEKEDTSLTRAVAKALYGTQLSGSVTRLEKFAACAFAHFVSYGLGLMERQEYKLQVPDIGNIFHSAIDIFSNKVKKSEFKWHTLPDELRDEFALQSVEEAAVSYGNQILKSSKRNEYMLTRVKRITKRTIWALCEQIKKGEFEPEAFELQFSFLEDLDSVNVRLSENEKMQLQGRIDRVDVLEEPERNRLLVKVIDYKSGRSALDMGQVYYGLQLQLAVYLSASMELERKKHKDLTVEPAGIFYYNIEDPIVDKAADVEKAILKELKMNGLVNADISIAKKMDVSFVDENGVIKGSTKSSIIPFETDKSGFPTKRSSVTTSGGFDNICTYASQKMSELGKEIVEGKAQVDPYKLGDKTACDYCEYNGICRFDVKLPGNHYRALKKMQQDDAIDAMVKRLEEEEE